jgi:undecaprenyl-diphosphatase
MVEFSLREILVLAVVQGIGEFLPISSSGHVVIAASLLSDSKDLHVNDVNIMLHMGTLLSILVFYWQRVWRLLTEDRRIFALLLLGTIPAVIVGFPLKALEREVLDNPLVAGLMLPVTGAILLLAGRIPVGTIDYRAMTWRQALTVGLAQAAAILPGISRSGSTITAGLGSGLSRESAATFSFLLAIPILAGIGIVDILKIALEMRRGTYVASAAPLDMAIGAAVAFVVGLVALWILVRLLERGRLHIFAWYTIAAGVLVVAWQVWEMQ